jgi:FrmR/RcnR family transcriptional regulator, repressor of frmRAB operon
MGHVSHQKDRLIARVRRLRGQLEAVERELESDADCADVLHLLASVRGAMNGLVAEVIEDHIRSHVVNPDSEPDPLRQQGAEELIGIVRTYMK